MLKTLLFTTIMVSQSVLTTAVYHRPLPQTHQLAPLASPRQSPTPSSLSLSVLSTLSRLSFVISQFGGVLSTAEGGFSELRRTFYTALDVLSSDIDATESFVRSIWAEGEQCSFRMCPTSNYRRYLTPGSSSSTEPPSSPLIRSKQALHLACVEQLVPVLKLSTVEYSVFPLCLP